MRVAAKIILVMVLILVVIRTVEGAMTVQRETTRLNADIERDAELMSRVLTRFVSAVWAAQGRGAAIELLESVNVGGHPVRLSWVPIDGEWGVRRQLGEGAAAALAGGEAVSLRHTDPSGEAVYSVCMPIDAPGAEGAIRMTERLAERSRYLDRAVLREVLAGGSAVTLGALAMGFAGSVVIGGPLSRLRKRISEIGEGNLVDRVEVRGRDELAALGAGLNAMCAKLSASYRREREATRKRIAALEQMRHADRLTTIGRLASGIAHELGTPLNVVSGRAGMIADAVGPEASRVRDHARVVGEQADRMAGIIRHLLDFARVRRPERVQTGVLGVMRRTADLVTSLGFQGRVRVTPPEPADLGAEMDPGQIQQVLINLIENALQAMPGSGEVTVSASVQHAQPPPEVGGPAGRFLRVDVADRGAGIAPEHIPHVFDPFFTTKDVGQGTGMGLSVVHGIVREHGGWVGLESELGRGSRFSVFLPYDAGDDRPRADR